MTVVDAINLMEIPWWIGCGACVAFRCRRSDGWRGMVAAGTLVLFGLSDLVELQTGAWWRPWWLAVWKGGCLVSLLICLMLHRRATKRLQSDAAQLKSESNEPQCGSD